MIGSILLGGSSFGARQIAQAAAIVGGTSVVTLAEGGGKKGRSSALGLLLIILALGCDGVVGGVQKRIQAQCQAQGAKIKPYDLMFLANGYMAMMALAVAAARSELQDGIAYCRANPAISK